MPIYSVAIPDSCLADESTQLDKTRKISIIARACAIFGIHTIYIYNDRGSDSDRSLLVTILKYLETPAFLRKRLFPRVNELKYAGVLSPLKIPSHVTPSSAKKIRIGDVREGIIVPYKGKRFVDVGVNQLVPYHGKKDLGKRLTVQFRKVSPEFDCKEITRDEAKQYWGYMVKERAALPNLLSNWEGKVILTSRKGKNITPSVIHDCAQHAGSVLVVYGSTEKGVHEILGGHISKIQNCRVLNFFPKQNTETVRLEEAMHGTLGILESGL